LIRKDLDKLRDANAATYCEISAMSFEAKLSLFVSESSDEFPTLSVVRELESSA